MVIEKKHRAVKRFGARYGRRVRKSVAVIESAKRSSNKCPYCNKKSVKRLATGIWECGKCNAKFTGKAYIIGEPRKSKASEEV